MRRIRRVDDIDFESVEFSKAFTVRSKDKKFAYNNCHTRMMEYMLGHKDLNIEIQGNCAALGFDSRLAVDAVSSRMEQLVAIRALFPEYLFKQ